MAITRTSRRFSWLWPPSPPLFNYVVQQRSLWRGMHDLNRAMRYIDKLERGGGGVRVRGRRWGARDFNEGSERGIENYTGIPGLLEDEGERISKGGEGGGWGFLESLWEGGLSIRWNEKLLKLLELLELRVYFRFRFEFLRKLGLAKFFNCSEKRDFIETCKLILRWKRDKGADRSWHFFVRYLKKKNVGKNFPYYSSRKWITQTRCRVV